MKCKELTYVQKYVCLGEVIAEPPVRGTVSQSKGGQHPQRIKSVVHTLARTSSSGERASAKQ